MWRQYNLRIWPKFWQSKFLSRFLSNSALINKFLHEGHWNDAYQFVSLHQPAAYYGVNSRELGEGGNDLVSKSQILAYYELVLKDFLATGKVIYPK